jgi:hypothetical protein
MTVRVPGFVFVRPFSHRAMEMPICSGCTPIPFGIAAGGFMRV